MPKFAIMSKLSINNSLQLSCGHIVKLLDNITYNNLMINDKYECDNPIHFKGAELMQNATNSYNKVEYPDGKDYTKNGSPEFYKLLDGMAETHDKKSHDYVSNDNPFGNYHFAGELSKLFDNPYDSGFVSRIGEKLYRLANMENSGKQPKNESVEDTEIDIVTICALWMASRRERRNKEMQSIISSLGGMKGTGG